MVLLSAIGFIHYFVVSFKGSATLPNDIYIFAIGSAVAVAGGHDFVFPNSDFSLLLGCPCMLTSLQFMVPLLLSKRWFRINRAGANILFALVIGGVRIGCFNSIDLDDTFGTDKAIWQLLPFYKQ